MGKSRKKKKKKKTKSYVNDDNLEIALNMLPGDFSILSLNCQSLTAKVDSLKVLIENINKRCKLSAI